MRKVIFLMMFILVMTIVPSSVSADEQGKEMYYYIMIDRFQNSDASKENIDINDPVAHHGGDFLGIQNRIDHFKQIGVTSVILSPIFESGTYSGFESVNYNDIQSTFGTEEELRELIEQFNEADIDVLLHFPIDINGETETDALIGHIENWMGRIPFAGIYLPIIDGIQDDFYEDVHAVLDDYIYIGKAERDIDIDQMLELGFDKIVHPFFYENAVQIFSDTNEPFDPLVDSDLLTHPNVIHYMELYDTDRFANVVEENGYHPRTHWRLVFTHLMTIPNDLLVYQGSEMALGGFIDDHSNNEMMTFLTGDNQIVQHMEKISSAIEDRPSLSQGEMNLFHSDDSYLVYERKYEDESTVIAINLSDSLKRADVQLNSDLELRGALINDLIRENDDGTYSIVMEREASNVFIVQNDIGIYWPMVIIFVGVLGLFIIFSIVMYRKKS